MLHWNKSDISSVILADLLEVPFSVILPLEFFSTVVGTERFEGNFEKLLISSTLIQTRVLSFPVFVN